jgi:hypothetical protein
LGKNEWIVRISICLMIRGGQCLSVVQFGMGYGSF